MAETHLDIDSLKPNSHAYKAQQAEQNEVNCTIRMSQEDVKKLEQIRKRKAESKDTKKLSPIVKKEGIVTTKKSLGQKFAEAFISEDIKDVKSYIFFDVVIPTVKDTILNVGEMILFGGVRGRRGDSYRDRDRVPYSSYYRSEYNGRRSRDRRRDSRRREEDNRDDRDYQENEKVDYRNIVLRNRIDAEEVVAKLRECIRVYDQATVAELFDLIDVTSSYVDSNWGWTNPEDIGIRRVSSGYLIDVAEARYLD